MKVIPPNRSYMQSPEFWNAPHNKKMAEITTRLILQRDIMQNFATLHTKDYTQTTNGSLRQIPKKGLFKFLKGPSIYEDLFVKSLNRDYRSISLELNKAAKQVRKMLHK